MRGRSRRVDGRVFREYVGGGTAGHLAARLDAAERDERRAAAAALRAELGRLGEANARLAGLNDLANLLGEAALLAAGYPPSR